MKSLAVLSTIAIVGCAHAAAPPAPAPATTMKVEGAAAAALDVEPDKPRTMQAPSRPVLGGFAIDDHVGAHAVSREEAIDSIARYDVFGAMRVTMVTPHAVKFDVLNVDGVASATFGVVLGQVERLDRDEVLFTRGKMFVGALAIDPAIGRDARAWVIVPVQNENEALEVMMKASAAAARSRRGR